jgi:hypothetical protein
MSLRHVVILALALVLATSEVALADDGHSICGPYRGLTRGAQVEGFAELAFDQFFVDGCASNVDYEDASVEVDVGGGFSFSLSKDTAAALKASYHFFPGEDIPAGGHDLDYFDLSLSALQRVDIVTFSGEVDWSPEFMRESGNAVFGRIGASVPLTDSFIVDPVTLGPLTASAHLGRQWIENNTNFGTPDYTTWDVGLSLGVEIGTVDLRWVDTDLSGPDCVTAINRDFCKGGLLLTFSIGAPGYGGVPVTSTHVGGP